MCLCSHVHMLPPAAVSCLPQGAMSLVHSAHEGANLSAKREVYVPCFIAQHNTCTIEQRKACSLFFPLRSNKSSAFPLSFCPVPGPDVLRLCGNSNLLPLQPFTCSSAGAHWSTKRWRRASVPYLSLSPWLRVKKGLTVCLLDAGGSVYFHVLYLFRTREESETDWTEGLVDLPPATFVLLEAVQFSTYDLRPSKRLATC